MPRSTPRPHLLIPIAAFLATLPLILKGGSCGHDMVFHVQGWYDAAAQLRHLHYPHWSFTSAWNAGEPRFIFYPPLSWLLGALLTLILPPQAAVSTFIFLSLTLSGFTMYRLAAHFTTPNAALIAATLYLANPYMLLNAFERSAFAELLASAWVPLLLLAVLRRCPTVPGLAIPLALLWLTNAPAAVMASYTLALLATLRVATSLIKRHHDTLCLALTYIAGTVLGLTLPAFYLIPAAYERRFIQVAMAIIPGMRVQDNFLFVHTNDPGHNGVNVQISLLAATLYTLTIATVIALLIRAYRQKRYTPTPPASRHNSNAAFAFLSVILEGDLLLAVATLTAALVLMLSPISIPIWNHLPELHYLQFPWRILTMVSAVLTLSIARLIGRPKSSPRSHHNYLPILATLILAFTLGHIGFYLYAQFSQPNDRPQAIAAFLRAHHGYPPTDEYTPNNADSDVLRTQNPAFWLIPSTADPNTPAPNTLPTPAELDPNLQNDDTPIPVTQTISESAPLNLPLTLLHPETLILNLRDYPNWQVSTGCEHCLFFNILPHLQRDDGLIAISLPAGSTTIHIHWRTTADQQLGLALSIAALLVLLWLLLRPQRSTLPANPNH